MNKTWVNSTFFVYFRARLVHRADLFGASMLRSPVIFVVSEPSLQAARVLVTCTFFFPEIPGHERDMDGVLTTRERRCWWCSDLGAQVVLAKRVGFRLHDLPTGWSTRVQDPRRELVCDGDQCAQF